MSKEFFMQCILTTFFTALLLFSGGAVKAQVSGTVFHDYNANGIQDLSGTITAGDGNSVPTAIDAGIAGITVSAYDAAGALINSTTSGGDGTYTLEGLSGSIRIEFSSFPANYYATFNGSNSRTSVQFVSAPATDINFGINRPYEYAEDNPLLAVGGFTPLSHTGANASNPSVLTTHNADGSTTYLGNTSCVGWGVPCPTGFDTPSPTTVAIFNEVGGVYGLGWQASTKTLFAATYVKTLSDVGPQGTGAIYRIDMSNPSSPVVLNGTPNTANGPIDLNLIFGANTCGVNPFAPYPDFNLESERQKVGDAVYNTAFADIDVSEDGTKLYALSFADKKLYIIPIDGSPINASTITSVTIPVMSGETLSSVRGTAIGQKDGLLYIMTQGHFIIDPAFTFDQNNTINPTNARYQYIGENNTQPFAVYTFDPQTNTFGLPILSFNNYTGPLNGTGASSEWLSYAGYMVMDIVFDNDGSMIMGGRNIGHDVKGGAQGVRLLKACTDGNGNYVLEDNSSCGGNTTAGTDLFYFQVDASDGGSEDAMGGLAQIPGAPYVVETAYDIYRNYTAGVRWLDNTAGTHTKGIELIPNTAPTAAFAGINFSNKTGVLGDIEVLASPAPLEIGNRIWSDTDSDGIQDANEVGIDGIGVELYEGATLVGTATTANGGQWFFNTNNITGGVKPNTAYIVRVQSASFPTGQSLTGTNTDGTTNGDVRDNDATLVGGNAEIAYTTGNYGENNHTLDIGFRAACSLSATATGTNVNCNAGSDGTALATASGNAGAVTYLWSNNETSAAISGLVADSYTVTITETPTCTAIASYQVSEPNLLSVNCTHTDVTTNGGSDGTANVSVTGGTLPYLYLWSSNETAASISAKTADTYTVTVTDFNGCTAICSRTINEPAAPNPDLSLTKTVSNAIATLNGTVTYTLTLTNDNGIDATGVVVTDYLPNGVTFVSSSAPANVNVSGNTVTWNVGNFLGSDTPKTLQITVTADSEGMFINNTEITAMNETDDDSTPNNNLMGEDDQDQACFSVPIVLCSDNPSATISIVGINAASYQWYVSADNGTTYTALSGETNQTLVVNNTLMGGNGITKYFKVAYNGADITGACGEVMCCPVIINTQSCIVCPPQRCLTVIVTKN